MTKPVGVEEAAMPLENLTLTAVAWGSAGAGSVPPIVNVERASALPVEYFAVGIELAIEKSLAV